MSLDDHVTICVPVYNGRAFVAETLSAIQRQNHEHLTVLISDDASDDKSAEICRAFTDDARVRLVVQPSRLGWIENCNWLLARAESELVCIVSHDDLPEPDHIAALVERLSAEPDCALAFTDIRVFGLLDKVEHQPSIAGTPAERVRAFIATHFDGTAFHALIRRQAIRAARGLRGNDRDNFAADVSWLGRLARAGAFARVPEPLYRKRRHTASASMRWGDWSDDTKASAWALHCGELLQDALDQPLASSERELVIQAAVRRTLAIEPSLPFGFIRDWPRSRQEALVAAMRSGSGDDAIVPS